MTAQAIRVELTERLVGELPRFFGGRLPAFRELFQNAYRAGAKNVRLTLEGQTLTVEDDGVGCPDPKLLLAAGQTGWDEGRVVEPAGLGFFSLLGQDVSASVAVESYGWRVVLVPQHVLARKPVVVTPGSVTRGLRLVMLLTEPDPERDLTEARAYYPFTVTLNGKEIPPHRMSGDTVVETPVGRVHLERRFSPLQNGVLWEHRPVHGEAFGKALQQAARGAIQTAILHTFRVEWVANMDCGVTPKLPDRNDLQQSPALVAAAGSILSSIESHFLALARGIVATWPETVRDVYGEKPGYETPDWLMRSVMGTAILEHLGWAVIGTARWDDPVIYHDDNGWHDEQHLISVVTRRFVRVKGAYIAESINNAAALGAPLPWAVRDDEAHETLSLKLIGLRGPKTAWVRLAREIQVGPLKLPFLFVQEGETGSVILACGPDEAVRAVLGGNATLGGFEADYSDHVTGFIACHDYDSLNDSWGVYETDSPYVDWRELKHDVVQQVTENFLPKALAKARAHHHELVLARDDLQELQRRADRLARSGAFRGDAGLKHARVGIHQSLRRLDKRLQEIAARAHLPS